MLTPEALTSAADLIWHHWHAGTTLPELPAAWRPADRRDGYAIQAMLAMKARSGLIGWKIAATSSAGQAHIGVDGPLAGRLMQERAFASGATVRLTANRMRVAEPEFAFRLGRDLAPRREPWTTAEVLAAVDALLPAIEIPDSRFTDFARVGAAQLIADLACAHELVLGEPTSADWRAIDLATHAVHASVGTRYTRDGVGANVLGDPRKALVWLANELSGLGVTLVAGDIVITGTSMVPLDVAPGDEVQADFGPLGRVRAQFA